MTKFLYLVGAPATGKSSVMREIYNQLGVVTGDWYKIHPTTHAEFRGEPMTDVITGEYRGLSLGVTRLGFSGTDAIGMASSSEAQAWIESDDELPELILGEGSRLTIGKFFAAVAQRCDLTIGHLVAGKEVLDARCEARGSQQSETFRKSGATRAVNACAVAAKAGASILELDTTEYDPVMLANILLSAAEISL